MSAKHQIPLWLLITVCSAAGVSLGMVGIGLRSGQMVLGGLLVYFGVIFLCTSLGAVLGRLFIPVTTKDWIAAVSGASVGALVAFTFFPYVIYALVARLL